MTAEADRRINGTKKWGPALLPAPTAPSEGSAGVRNLVRSTRRPQEPALDPGSPAQASAFHPTAPSAGRSPTDLLDIRPGGSPVFRPVQPAKDRSPRLKPSDVPRPFLGQSRPASRFAHHAPKNDQNRVARDDNHLFRRLFPAGPASAPERASTLPAGGDRTFGHLPRPLPFPAPGRPGPPSRSPKHHAHRFRVAKAKNGVTSLWITGISGTTVGTLSQTPVRESHGPSACCRCVLLRLPRSCA
jgi:hypothetical protein